MDLFIELIQVALGVRTSLSEVPTEKEWLDTFQVAEKQALIGLVFSAVEKLNEKDKTIMPPMPLFYEWMGIVLNTESQNKRLNEAAGHLTRILKNGGLRSCVLKGQGVASLYPQPLRRQPGDIDLWVEGGREKVLKFLRNSFLGIGHVVIHHVDTRIIEGVETEIHFMPVYACNPILHHKLQKFFREQSEEQFTHFDTGLGFAYPTLRFNAVYLLAHIYMHFLYEGIGLRQLIDYYYVLIRLSQEEKEAAIHDIKRVGLMKIAGAVIYVLNQTIGNSDNLLFIKADEKRGKVLYNEIIQNGNFGKYDEGLKGRDEKKLISFNLVAFRRQMKFILYYPWDVISIPFFKIGHWCWRKINGYI